MKVRVERKKPDIYESNLDQLARHMLPVIEQFYQSEAGQHCFEEWKRSKEKEGEDGK